MSGKQMALQTWTHPLNVYLSDIIMKNTLFLSQYIKKNSLLYYVVLSRSAVVLDQS